MLILKIIKPDKIIDTHGNQLQNNEVQAKLKRYRFISQSEKANAETAGAASLYAMIPSIACSIGISLILYFLNIVNEK